MTKNAKALWSFIKSNRRDHFGVPILQDSTGPPINKSRTKANLLNDDVGPLPAKNDDQNSILFLFYLFIYKYSRTSIIQTPLYHLHYKSVQISEFVRISEAHSLTKL